VTAGRHKKGQRIMKLQRGNIFAHQTDILLVTTNSVINKQGKLVMGRGAAKMLSLTIPPSQENLAYLVRVALEKSSDGLYGVVIYSSQIKGLCRAGYGAFQVKDKWWEDARLSIIEYSTQLLCELATMRPSMKFSLNFPGIGNGRLKREDVLPIIEGLPDNVTVWEL
jgi:hypothetical protein